MYRTLFRLGLLVPALLASFVALPSPGGAEPASEPSSTAQGAATPQAQEPEGASPDEAPAAGEAAGGEELAEAEAPAEPESAIGRLVQEADTVAAEVADLRSRHDAANADKRKLLQPQLEDLRSRYRRQLVTAADTLVGDAPLEGGDEERAAAVEHVRALLVTEGRHIRTDLKRTEDELATMIGVRERVEKEDLAAHLQQRDAAIARRTQLLGERDVNLSARSQIGEDVSAERAKFQRELEDHAKLVSAALHETADAIDKLGGDEDDPEAQKELRSRKELRDHLADLQRKQLALLDEAGVDTAQFRQDLIATTGEVSGDILDARVARGLLQSWKDDAVQWVSDRASSVIFSVVSFVLILLLFGLLARIARWGAQRAMDRARGVSSLASDFVVKTAGRAVMLVGLMIAAAQVGIEVGPLLAGLGIAGFVLGFALQDTLSNFASGMMILMYRPFDVGDVIEAGGVMGNVKAMNLVNTAIVTFDNQMLVVPNSKIWGDVIRNVTHQASRRVDLVFGIGYGDDIDHAERVLTDILEQNPMVLKEPAPVVRLHELGDSSVNFIVRPWVATAEYWNVYWDITREVKRRFDAEGISIPFPQRDVHVYEERLLRREPAPRTRSEVVPAPGQEGDAEELSSAG